MTTPAASAHVGGPARRRDSAGTRRLLLDAARDLFAARGYDRTTLREVGERAGVDAALVARYFGNKAALYSAAIDADNEEAGRAPINGIAEVIDRVLTRVDEDGVGPLIQGMLAPQADTETRAVAAGHLRRRLVAPVVEELVAHGLAADLAATRAEAVVAAVLGIATVRHLGGFSHLAAADRNELVGILTEAFAVS